MNPSQKRLAGLTAAPEAFDMMPRMTSRPGPSRISRPWPVVAIHGVFLLALLVFFRIHKVVFSELSPAPLAWFALFLPDLGFVLIFECFWLVVSRGRASRWWRTSLHSSHAVVYLFVVLAHHFFLNTGYRIPFDLAAYAVANLRMLRDLLMVTGGGDLWRDLAVAAVAFGLAVALPRIPRLAARPAPHRFLFPAAIGIGLVLLAASPLEEPQLRNISRNDLLAFAASAIDASQPGASVGPLMTPPDGLYRAPRLEPRRTGSRPNIVLILLESTGAQAVGTDFSAGLTPNLEAIAAESVIVEQAYGTVSHTSKALVGLLCGMTPRLDLEIVESLEGNLPIPCLPTLLGNLGYRTAFLQTALASFENRPGLVANLGFQFGAYQETLERPPFQKMGYFGLDEFAMIEPALRWTASDRPEPFFLTLLTISPHHPYETPGVNPGDAENEELYRDTLRHQDRFVGELYRGLEAAGALENTLLVIIGDHGEAFGEHQLFEHDAVPYEEVVWTPWLLHGSALVGEPRRIGGLRSHLDFLPTVLELLGGDWEGLLPGKSLLATAGHERVITSCWYRNHCLGMRRGDRKAVYKFGHGPTELFDLERDPAERRDLAATLTAQQYESLEAEMLAFKLSIDAFWARYPVADGPPSWWEEEAELSGGGATP